MLQPITQRKFWHLFNWAIFHIKLTSILLHTTDVICLHLEPKALAQRAECLTQGHIPSKGQILSHLKQSSTTCPSRWQAASGWYLCRRNLVQEIGLSWWSWHCFRWRDITPLPKKNRARKSACPPCPHPSQFQLWNSFEIIFSEQQKYRILSRSVSQWHSPSRVVSQSWNKM